MSAPSFTMRQLLEAGVHFGHQTRRWNPKMKPYIFGARNGVHIINLESTVPMLHQALMAVKDTAENGGRVLFVGTKRQAQGKIAEAAKKCGQYYVNHRWLGGMMTNWATISNSIKRLKTLEEQLADTESLLFTKREMQVMTRERDNLERALGGIKDMGGLPDILIVIDTNKESIAIAEAARLNIPVVAVVDTNCDPNSITFPVPGNDDALRAIDLYCNLFADAVLNGIQTWKSKAGIDAGAAVDPAAEAIPAKAGKKEEKAASKEEVKAETEKKEEKKPAKKAAAKKDDADKAEKKPAKKAATKKTTAKKADDKKAEDAPAKKSATAKSNDDDAEKAEAAAAQA